MLCIPQSLWWPKILKAQHDRKDITLWAAKKATYIEINAPIYQSNPTFFVLNHCLPDQWPKNHLKIGKCWEHRTNASVIYFISTLETWAKFFYKTLCYSKGYRKNDKNLLKLILTFLQADLVFLNLFFK